MRDLRSMRGPGWLALVVLLGACGGGRDDASQSAAAGAPSTEATPSVAVAPPEPADNGESPVERRRRMLAEVPAPEEWHPPEAASSSAPVDEILQRADVAFEHGRIERGQDNALQLYLAVLARDPGNAAANAGIERVVLHLQERIDRALEARDYDAATAAMPVLHRLRGNDAAVQALERRVEAARGTAMLLAEAARLADAGRVLEPADDSAAAVYAEVLQRDPQEPTALEALARIESELLSRATARAEAGDYAASDRLVAQASRLRPGSAPVQDTSTRIVEMRQGRAGQLLARAHEAIDDRDLTRAQQLLAQLERVSAQAQGIEELRLRLEQARLYGGFPPGTGLVDPLASGGNAPELVVVPVGEFVMGAPSDEQGRKKSEGPRHKVRFARGFAISRGETTVGEFRAFVEATGYRSSAQLAGRSPVYDERSGNLSDRRGTDWRRDYSGAIAEPELPVVHVSWEDAKAYADWLSRETGKQYRLPSEAEFEYVLRAGSSSRYWWGDGSPVQAVENLAGALDRAPNKRSWTNGFDGYGDGYWGAAPVRSLGANPFGVHDMGGNVSEWVEDCWHDTYSRAPKDGSPWVNPGCNRRVIRGASWASSPDQARSAFRIHAAPEATNARVGFRVVREL